MTTPSDRALRAMQRLSAHADEIELLSQTFYEEGLLEHADLCKRVVQALREPVSS